MALGVSISSGEGGDYADIVKFDARSGRAFRQDRKQDSSGAYVTDPVDITTNFKAVMDFENLEVGYIEFPAGSAPIFALVRHGQPMPGKPTANAKQGVRVTMMLNKDCGGEKPLREMAGVSGAFLRGMDALHDAYLAGKDTNVGKLPVVVLKTTLPIKSGSGQKTSTNYQPVFEIASWTTRPEKLVSRNPTPARQEPTRAAPPATGSTLAAPPTQPAQAAQPEMADADDFG